MASCSLWSTVRSISTRTTSASFRDRFTVDIII
jgi:hypothetical protein